MDSTKPPFASGRGAWRPGQDVRPTKVSEPTRVLNEPEPGYFAFKYVRGGPWVPARIFRQSATDPETGEPLDRSPVLQAQVGVDEPTTDPQVIERVWTGHRITEAEYEHLIRVLTWAREHAPDAPEANPDKAIDLNRQAPIF